MIHRVSAGSYAGSKLHGLVIASNARRDEQPRLETRCATCRVIWRIRRCTSHENIHPCFDETPRSPNNAGVNNESPSTADAASRGAPTTAPRKAPTQALIVYCTCAERHAQTLASVVVEARLAACVNIVPGVKSVFRWQGRVQTDNESLLVIKTTRARYAELEEALQQRHPYELPELLAVPVQAGLPAYLDWMNDATT